MVEHPKAQLPSELSYEVSAGQRGFINVKETVKVPPDTPNERPLLVGSLVPLHKNSTTAPKRLH